MIHICSACGYDRLIQPPNKTIGIDSPIPCAACGFEFKTGDDPRGEANGNQWRERWIQEGRPWFSKTENPPEGWDPTRPIYRVKRFFAIRGLSDRIREFHASSATVELAAAAVGVAPARIAKTLSFHSAKDGCMLVVTAGDQKIDNMKFKTVFGIKAKMLTPDEVLERLNYEVGGVCPFDLPSPTPVYLDLSLCRFDFVYPACGSANSAARLTCEELYALSAASAWVDVSKGVQSI